MRKLSSLALAAVTVTAVLLGGAASAAAVNRWVNDDGSSFVPPGTSCMNPGYATIQSAVNTASPGDVIKVCPGSYRENVTVSTNNLTVMSTGGASVTTVSAATSFYVFNVTGTGLTLKGLTIRPAGTADGDIGVNMAIDGNTGATLTNNVIISGRIGINLGCVSSRTKVGNNTISEQTDAGINIDTCEAPPFPGSHHNTVHHNLACSVTNTASIALGGSSDNNKIHHNTATTISVFGAANRVHDNVTKVAIVDNGTNSHIHDNTVNPSICP
jgi:hypothetical protein